MFKSFINDLSTYRGDFYTHFLTQNVNLTFKVGGWVQINLSWRFVWRSGSKENPISKEKIL